MIDRIDWGSVVVGDTLWLSEPAGWSSYKATAWRVTKRSPKGQLTLERFGSNMRVTPRGSIIGESAWTGRRFVTGLRAAELNADHAKKQAWIKVRDAAALLDEAARVESHDKFGEAIKALRAAAQGIEAGTAETGTVSVHESPTPQGDAPKDQDDV